MTTINDLEFTHAVARLHDDLMKTDAKYRALMASTFDENSVEGALVIDDIRATLEVEKRAIATGVTFVSNIPAGFILEALRAVMIERGIPRARYIEAYEKEFADEEAAFEAHCDYLDKTGGEFTDDDLKVKYARKGRNN